MSTLLPGIVAHAVKTPRLTANVLERAGTGDPVVFIHGNVSSAQFYMPTMLALPDGVRALAIDLRGFGDSETLPVDATRGLRDFSDDVLSVLDALGVAEFHVVGWSMGGGVVMQLMLDASERLLSVTLESPVSPYGFGGTRLDGSPVDAVGAGVGGGAANPEFVKRLQDGDTSEDPQVSPRAVYRTAYVKHPENVPNEDIWVESMLSTKTGEDNYPGDSVATELWPGFAAGSRGILNTMAPAHLNLSGIADLAVKPRVLWIRGTDDAIVSDTSFFDINYLGQLGVIPGWPGEDVAPAQPMVSQMRAVLERYGNYTELAWDECGHGPHLDAAAEFDAALAQHIRG
jgi:pimeloyl-ACP methyl ester carboxylesterase